MLITYGKVDIRNNSVVANLSKDFSDYYRSLIPKYIQYNPQYYRPHITIIRNFENPKNSYYKIFLNKIITIYYSNDLQFDNPYYYFNCWSNNISDIRIGSGLSKYRKNNSYHITIGNIKCIK